MATKIEAYKCQWCNKISATKSGIKNHENNCHFNPEFNCCANCVHGGVAKEDNGDFDFYFAPYCNHFKRFIFDDDKSKNAYFLECETDDGCHGYRQERPIPYTCWHFKSKGYHGFSNDIATDGD